MGDTVLSEFELERLRKIESNKERLGDLQLVQLAQSLKADAPAKKKREKRKKEEPTEPVERRRSSRLEAIVTGKPAEFAEPLDLPEDDDDFEAQPKRQSRPRQPAGERAPAAPGSCRAMSAHVAEVRKEFLGRLMPPPDGSGAMKASVMARLRGSSTPPSHNKYSGIQEWKDAIALFVNVASAKGAFYHNLFLQGGRRMTWFAQPTHVPETPAIKRILATRREGEAGRGKVADGEGEGQGEDEGEVPVVLFCRQDGQPYVCCGLVRCVGFDEGHSPLKFVLQLEDFDEAGKQGDFRELMSAALEGGGDKKSK